MFLDTVNEFRLEQQVGESTRENHILDLVFVPQPSAIDKIYTIPGMSDHHAISFEVVTSLEKFKLKERKVFQYHKADEHRILSATCEFCGKILNKIHTIEPFMIIGISLKPVLLI